MDKIDIKLKERLTTTYMNLFDALAAWYLANGASNGESLYLATGAMHKILSDLPRTPASEYIIAFFNTHKKSVAKKSMVSASKDEKITVIASDVNKKLTISVLELQSVLENAEFEMMKQLKLPEILPMSENLIQDAVREIKPKYHTPPKQNVPQIQAFIKNYNLRNARRRLR